MTLRHRPLGQPLKESAAYKADREAQLARLAIETPDCMFEECTDCCYLERQTPEEAAKRKFPYVCPECGGQVLIGIIANGEVHA